MISKRTLTQFASEFLCTMLLVNLMCLACSALDNSLVPLSFAYGLIQLILTYCFRPISGGHANPAVSIALWLRGCMNIKRLLIYIVAQILGAIAGHYAANKILGKDPSDTLCSFAPKSLEIADTNLMAAEFFLTFVLVMTWCVLWEYEGELPMEWYLAAANILICLLGGYITGASTNPARALAPYIFSEKDDRTKFLIAGQILAGVAAPFVWSVLEQ